MVSERFPAYTARPMHSPRILLLVLAALWNCACASVASRTWNLEQLHAEDSSYRYTAALMNDWEYLLREQLFAGSPLIQGGWAKKSPSAVENPAGETLDALLGLEELDASDRYARARRIQWCARLAVEDPSALCRERALLGLCKAAQALFPIQPELGPKSAELSSEAALASALAELVRCARAVEASGPSATSSADLEGACALVRTRKLDLGGARRALEVATSLASSLGFERRGLEPLSRLVEDLERLCVARAIAKALGDPEGKAQSAAIDAAVAAAGPELLAALLNQVQPTTDALVVIRIVELLAQHGWVRQAVGAPPEAELLRQQERALIELVLTRPEGEVRVAAMRTLGALSDSGPQSLREEDWQRWYMARQTPSGAP